MARYIEDASLDQPIDVVSMVMEDYIYHNRFVRTDWNGEPVYCSRDARGKEKYLIWSYASGILHLEAWVKGLFGGESGLNGGAKAYRESLEALLKRLREHSGNVENVGYIGQDPFLHSEEQHQQSFAMPVGTQGNMPGNMQGNMQGSMPGNMSGTIPGAMPGGMPAGRPDSFAAEAGLVMGIIGIIMGILMPIMGILIGAIGLNRCRLTNTTAGKGKAARTLCIIAIVIGIAEIVLGMLMGVVGMLMLPSF